MPMSEREMLCETRTPDRLLDTEHQLLSEPGAPFSLHTEYSKPPSHSFMLRYGVDRHVPRVLVGTRWTPINMHVH